MLISAAFICKNAGAMEWDDLRYVLAISRAGTLAGAARRLGVNQTTVARRLAAAERALGTQLFLRAEGALHPTTSGEAAIAQAARVEQSVEALQQGVSGADATPSGLVKLTAVPMLVNRLLVPALPDLASRFPRLRLELLADSRNASLARHEADVALRLARPAGRGSDLAKRIGHVGFAVYGPRRGGRSRPWITYEEGFGHVPQARWIATVTRGEALSSLRVSDAETILHSVRAGLGKSLLPRFVADGDPRLKCLSGGGFVLRRELWLLSRRDTRGSARISVVVDWVEQTVKARLPNG
jgi:DNA-binding transcriptional LysR family regulator